MARKQESKENMKVEEHPREEEISKPKIPEHNHSFYLHHSDNEYDYWKCSMSSCGYVEERPRRIEIVRGIKVPSEMLEKKPMFPKKTKTYEVQYHCRNCGHGFKVVFPFSMKATETELCRKCGINDSRRFIRKPE